MVSVLNRLETELMDIIDFEGSDLLAQLRKRGTITDKQENVIKVAYLCNIIYK